MVFYFQLSRRYECAACISKRRKTLEHIAFSEDSDQRLCISSGNPITFLFPSAGILGSSVRQRPPL